MKVGGWCRAEGGCGKDKVEFSEEDSYLFFPTPRQVKLGAKVFAICECPECHMTTKISIHHLHIENLIAKYSFRTIDLPEPETSKHGPLEADEAIDLYIALQNVDPEDFFVYKP